jgi:hypothetical protein
VRETDEDNEVLVLPERQLRNIPEELGWWYQVEGRFCNRCVCWLPRVDWGLCNWRAQIDTEERVTLAYSINSKLIKYATVN